VIARFFQCYLDIHCFLHIGHLLDIEFFLDTTLDTDSFFDSFDPLGYCGYRKSESGPLLLTLKDLEHYCNLQLIPLWPGLSVGRKLSAPLMFGLLLNLKLHQSFSHPRNSFFVDARQMFRL
jgi:hypothetical protein